MSLPSGSPPAWPTQERLSRSSRELAVYSAVLESRSASSSGNSSNLVSGVVGSMADRHSQGLAKRCSNLHDKFLASAKTEYNGAHSRTLLQIELEEFLQFTQLLRRVADDPLSTAASTAGAQIQHKPNVAERLHILLDKNKSTQVATPTLGPVARGTGWTPAPISKTASHADDPGLQANRQHDEQQNNPGFSRSFQDDHAQPQLQSRQGPQLERLIQNLQRIAPRSQRHRQQEPQQKAEQPSETQTEPPQHQQPEQGFVISEQSHGIDSRLAVEFGKQPVDDPELGKYVSQVKDISKYVRQIGEKWLGAAVAGESTSTSTGADEGPLTKEQVADLKKEVGVLEDMLNALLEELERDTKKE